MDGHYEEYGCTMYEITCILKVEGMRRAMWFCNKRLCDLREHLHDVVHEALQDKYSTYFGASPFARHGGLPGTTARLTKWLASLAQCLNQGVLSDTCALILCFLCAPTPEELVAKRQVDESLPYRSHRPQTFHD